MLSDARHLHHRYSILLGLILLLLAFQLAAPEGNAARYFSIVLQAVTLEVAVVTSRAHEWIVRGVTIFTGFILIAATAALIGDTEFAEDGGRLTSFLLISLTPAVIIRGLLLQFRESRLITRETMFGVLCIYLLIGLFFSTAFALDQAVSNEAFFTDGPGITADFLYFSFATITTTGYGDLVAATNLGRSLAITEALIGQIYLVTVVALIVGNVRSVAPERDRSAE